MSLEAVNPNQFTFPGMEEHGHRLARHVAAGVLFKTNADPLTTRNRNINESHEDWKRKARTPLAFDPPINEHRIRAYEAANPAHVLGEINWQGDAVSPSRYHPGEVTWVERMAGAYEGGDTKKPLHPGLMGDLFHAGHEIEMGQTTLPVHSTNRTAFGNPWAKKVGPPELVPKLSGKSVQTPPGFHPYERAGQPRQLAPAVEGQLSLRGVAGHVLREQQKVDERKTAAKVQRRRVQQRRPVSSATYANGRRIR